MEDWKEEKFSISQSGVKEHKIVHKNYGDHILSYFKKGFSCKGLYSLNNTEIQVIWWF